MILTVVMAYFAAYYLGFRRRGYIYNALVVVCAFFGLLCVHGLILEALWPPNVHKGAMGEFVPQLLFWTAVGITAGMIVKRRKVLRTGFDS